jgi:hypothetical protein
MQRLGLFAALALAASASAQNRATVSPAELASAVNRSDKLLNPARHRPVLAKDIRVVRCIGPEEEPTEFECTWRHKTKAGWRARKNWLAIDGRGWHVID